MHLGDDDGDATAGAATSLRYAHVNSRIHAGARATTSPGRHAARVTGKPGGLTRSYPSARPSVPGPKGRPLTRWWPLVFECTSTRAAAIPRRGRLILINGGRDDALRRRQRHYARGRRNTRSAFALGRFLLPGDDDNDDAKCFYSLRRDGHPIDI